ncbi:MAG: META domain-containing protein [Methylovulum sp.]|nr:META domain-containing protein [Methylovulum sp.]
MKYFIFAGLLVFLASCAAESQNPFIAFQNPINRANSTGALENTDWRIIAINNGHGGMVPSESPRSITIRFDNGNVHGNAGCNPFSATYTRNGNQLHIGQLRSTQRACAESSLMEQEAYFLQALMQVRQYQIMPNQLKLLDDKGLLMVDLSK